MNKKAAQKFAAILLLAAGTAAAQTIAGGGSIGVPVSIMSASACGTPSAQPHYAFV